MESNAEFCLWSHISPLRGSSLMMIAGMKMMLRFQVASSQLLWKLDIIAKCALFVKYLETIINVSLNSSLAERTFMISPSTVSTLINLKLKIATR